MQKTTKSQAKVMRKSRWSNTRVNAKWRKSDGLEVFVL